MKKMARKNTIINIRKMLRFLNVAKTWSLHKGCCKAICSKMAYFGVEEPKKNSRKTTPETCQSCSMQKNGSKKTIKYSKHDKNLKNK